LKSRHIIIVPSNNVDDSKIVEDDRVRSEIFSVVEKSLVNPDAPITDESNVSSANSGDVMDASVESSTPMPDDIIIPKDEPSESIALHLLVAYDETPKQMAICNDDYKFDAFSHNILQKFTIANEVTSMFHPDIVMTLHNQRTGFMDLKRNANITYELDIP